MVVKRNFSEDAERYLYEHTITKGNAKTRILIERHYERWRSDPTALEADEATYQQGVAEDVRNTLQRLKNERTVNTLHLRQWWRLGTECLNLVDENNGATKKYRGHMASNEILEATKRKILQDWTKTCAANWPNT